MVHDFDVVINGGGLAGSALALALARARWRVALFEPHPPLEAALQDAAWQERIYAFTPRAWGWLKALEVQLPRAAFVAAMHIIADRATLHFRAQEAALPYLAVIAEAERLRAALWEILRSMPNCTLITSELLSAFKVTPSAVQLRTEQGSMLSARLLIGAEGRNSWVRRQAGLSAYSYPYRHRALVANLRTAKPHANSAYQWFFGASEGILAFLPLADAHAISMVWSAPKHLADELIALEPEALADRVAKASESQLGALELLTPAAAFDLSLLYVPKITASRIALIGDAAHGIHPLSGHGINLGLHDAGELARLLGAPSQSADPGDPVLLARYRRMRAEEPWLTQLFTHGLGLLSDTDHPWLRRILGAGMQLLDWFGPKERLIRYAALGRC